MTANSPQVETRKRLRGQILELLDENHSQQRSRFTDVVLWGVLQRLKYDVSQNEVLTLLEDLHDRGYVKYSSVKNAQSGVRRLSQIEITPDGRDVLEGTRQDDAVHVLR